MTTSARTTRFDAVLYPNQSMGRYTFVLLMAISTTVATVLGIAFAHAGAWPVSGFLGLDLVLLYVAFRLAARAAGRRQRITLDADGLHVEAVDARGGRRYWRMEPFWVRVDIDNPPKRHSLVQLSSRGEALRIGQFLTLEERLDLARSLRLALDEAKHAPP